MVWATSALPRNGDLLGVGGGRGNVSCAAMGGDGGAGRGLRVDAAAAAWRGRSVEALLAPKKGLLK